MRTYIISCKLLFILTMAAVLLACRQDVKASQQPSITLVPAPALLTEKPFDTLTNTIHIFVALCDNKYQGIVPVPAGIGNGQDPNSNLYWGCGYGIRSYFKKSNEWKLLKTLNPGNHILERLVFKHATKQNQYLVADGYDGQYIAQCTKDFLSASAGNTKQTLAADGKTLGIGGNARLLGYIGHDGLMDFELEKTYKNTDGKTRDVIILACYSKMFFSDYLKDARVTPLVWDHPSYVPRGIQHPRCHNRIPCRRKQCGGTQKSGFSVCQIPEMQRKSSR